MKKFTDIYFESKKSKKKSTHKSTTTPKKVSAKDKFLEFYIPIDILNMSNNNVTEYREFLIDIIKKLGEEKSKDFFNEIRDSKNEILAIKGIPAEDLYKEEIIKKFASTYKEYKLKDDDIIKLFNLINDNVGLQNEKITNESLFSIPSIEEIAVTITCILIGIEALKFGFKWLFGFLKGLFKIRNAENIGQAYGEKIQQAMINNTKNGINKLLHKADSETIKAIKIDLNNIKNSKDKNELSEMIERLYIDLEKIDENEFNKIKKLLK